MKLLQKVTYFFSRYISPGIFLNAFKFSIFASFIPVVLVCIYLFFIRNTTFFEEYLLLIGFLLLAILISVLPLFKDYNTLANYLGALSLNRSVKFPNLKSSKVLVELIESIKVLSKSWEKTKLELNHKIIESKLIFDTIPDIILVVNSDFVIIKSNEQISEIYDKNPVGETIGDVVKTPLLEGCIRWVFHDKIGKQLEISIDSKESQKFFFAKVEYYQLDNESKSYAVVVLQDITEIKRTEKMFSDFIANASHEIKTPLASIMGVVETLQHAGKNDPKALKEFLPILQAQANRMSSLISDLLNLAQIEKLQNTPPDEEVDLLGAVQRAIENLKWAIKEGENSIIIKKHKAIPKVIGDESQLTQVFENLISNAIKYGGEKKDVVIEFGITDQIPKNNILISSAKRAVYISVIDQGDGIPKKYLPRLTERFFRADKSRSKKVGGTGLGLAIVKQILNRHEALLQIKSKIGMGSTFTALFPLKK